MGTFTITRRNGEAFAVLVDDADLESVLAAGPWHVSPRRHTVYVTRKHGGTTQYLHRFLTGAAPDVDVDHENRNGLDNRRANLRACTRSENLGNQAKAGGKSSAYKGVCWNKQRAKWQAEIQVNGRSKRLGLFDAEIEAHRAYCLAADNTFGRFARFS